MRQVHSTVVALVVPMPSTASRPATRRRRVAALSSALCVAVGFAGCGGGGGGGGGTPTQPQVPVRTVIAQENWTMGPLQTLPLDVSITGTGSGTMDVTADWTFATNDVDIYVTATSCSPDQFLLDLCTLLASANSVTAKPERLSLTVSAGNYRIWIVNFGETNESGTVEVGLTQ